MDRQRGYLVLDRQAGWEKKGLGTEKPLRTMCLEILSFFSSCIFCFDERSQLSWSAVPRCEAACLGTMSEAFATSLDCLQLWALRQKLWSITVGKTRGVTQRGLQSCRACWLGISSIL